MSLSFLVTVSLLNAAVLSLSFSCFLSLPCLLFFINLFMWSVSFLCFLCFSMVLHFDLITLCSLSVIFFVFFLLFVFSLFQKFSMCFTFAFSLWLMVYLLLVCWWFCILRCFNATEYIDCFQLQHVCGIVSSLKLLCMLWSIAAHATCVTLWVRAKRERDRRQL